MGGDRWTDPQGGREPKVPDHVGEIEGPPPDRPQLTVMTWNLYFGTDLSPIIMADKDKFVMAVATAFNEARATDFSGRAKAWADKIEASHPDLIGLQEAVIFRTQSPSDFIPGQPPPAPNATVVDTDMLELLLAELLSRGLDYAAVTAQVGQDIEAPGGFPTDVAAAPVRFDDIRLTQREVILVRKSDELTLTNVQGGQYDAHASAPTSVGATVELFWAWASVDVTFQEHSFRFATTHLDPDDAGFQGKQADEFLRGPGATELPLVWVGDFNSDADGTVFTNAKGDPLRPPATDTYQRLKQAGFTDAWTAKIPDRPGFTCCQDASLRNAESKLTQRVDFVLLRGPFNVVDASIVGDDPADRQPSGLWPSDHAGVVVTLEL
jgi:Endonuclease/Exonuclease/phosphatase family